MSIINWKAWRQLFVACTLIAGACAIEVVQAADPAEIQLNLKNGGFVRGTLLAPHRPSHLTIKTNAFIEPLEFDLAAVGSLSGNQPEPEANEEGHGFFLHDGSVVFGKLVELDRDKVVIDSHCLGRIEVTRHSLDRMASRNGRGRCLYSGPREHDWKNVTGPEWNLTAGGLATDKTGSIELAQALPNKSEINLLLTWPKSAHFSLAIGGILGAPADQRGGFARLEVWESQLVLVRENGPSIAIEKVADLTSLQGIELVIYLDKSEGLAVVCTKAGRLLAKVQVPAASPTKQTGILLTNYLSKRTSSILKLDRFELHEWNGQLPSDLTLNNLAVLLDTGETSQGELESFDPSTQQIVVTANGAETKFPLARIQQARFHSSLLEPAAVTPSSAVDATAEVSTPPAAPPVTPLDANPPLVFGQPTLQQGRSKSSSVTASQAANTVWQIDLSDGSRLIGRWLSHTEADGAGDTAAGTPDDRKLAGEFEVAGLSDPVRFAWGDVRGATGDLLPFAPASLSSTKAEFHTESSRLQGRLVDSNEVGSLTWHPEATSSPSRVAATATGRIVCRPPSPMRSVVAANDETILRRLARVDRVIVEDERVINVKREQPVVQGTASRVGLVFRTGDRITGQVQRIDERGVTFVSADADKDFVFHEQMESITLVGTHTPLDKDDEKFKRLMTVPRWMKSDPPTHLFVSVNGDFLRGRLVSLDEKHIVAEIRLENMQMERDGIAQIFWLHKQDWGKKQQTGEGPRAIENEEALVPNPAATTAPNTAVSETLGEDGGHALQVHALLNTGQAMTFTPHQVDGESIKGQSKILGSCEAKLSDLATLYFGRDVAAQLSQKPDEAWELSLAKLPKVFDEGASEPANESPLVGKPAPEFQLQTTNGDAWNLSARRGRVVVLDFWASWCGPCMQTMPEVERIVDEVGQDQVELVAVNLQESKERALAAIKRLDLSATVVLDADGRVAAMYEASAIPQTVIIDRTGKITHLFIGGGARFLTQFTAALSSSLETK